MAPSPKRRFPRPRRSGENPQVAAIDQPVLDQGLEQIGAAVNLELGAVLLLEALDLRNDVILDEVRRLPVGALEGGGDDVLVALLSGPAPCSSLACGQWAAKIS